MNRIRTIRSTAIAALLVATLAACSTSAAERSTQPSRERSTAATSTPTATVPATPRPTEPVDDLFPVGAEEARMHLACSGAGSSTVVFVAGFGGDSTSWAAVAPAVAKETRVCTYDRYGTGTSDAPPTDQTFGSQAEDLRELLRAAGEPGPYVVAGHSFGGAEAVTFASRFADEVDALLLVDASPVEWPTAACAVPDDGSEMGAGFRGTCATFDPAHNPERLDAAAAFAEVGRIDTLGDLPLVITTRADADYPGLSDDARAALASTWQKGQEHWASLSTDATIVPVEDTSHSIQLDQPAVVIEHLSGLLRRTHARHPA
ncbi:alpha/beta fold hydrolase [Aquihabitans daechungensis]|uniref:alpha/beta fold hydrolase n=1 Tax=Aquihabitans daechungensis TaxID=1052257 RepID=UPI003BA23774